MKNQSQKSTFFSHFIWYISGAIFPMLIGFIKTPIFTRHYSAADFGVLGLVLITFGYLSTLSFSWLSSCLWRYFQEFKNKKKLGNLYSNLLFFYAISSLVLIVISCLVFFFYPEDFLVIKLTFLACFHFILHELLGLYYIILRLKGKSALFNILASVQVLISFVILLFLAFVENLDISAMLWCSVIVDLGFIIYIIFKKGISFFKLKKIESQTQKQLLNFGGISLLATFVLMLIVSSDRYIIALYEPMSNVGVYSKTYDIAQMSILALIFVFFSTINPTMNKVLENNIKEAKNYINQYIYAFVFFLLPIVVLASIFRKEITQILLGEEFQSGFVLMPYIFFSMLLFGVIKFYENEYKFSKRLRQMVYYLIVGLVVNLILNFVLIPKFGMIWAAISTLLSYGIILSLFVINDHQKIFSIFKRNAFYKLVVCLTIFILVDLISRQLFDFSLIMGIIEACVFVLVLILIFAKDVKKLEIPMNL